ncbi:MAG: hypothetical protein RR500_08430 [Bacilli bacterium]
MACPSGTRRVSSKAEVLCVNNGWCTWYPGDSKRSNVEHLYDVCEDASTGATYDYYSHTRDMNTCC